MLALAILSVTLAVFITTLIWSGSESSFPFKILHYFFFLKVFICLKWFLKGQKKSLKAVVSIQISKKKTSKLFLYKSPYGYWDVFKDNVISKKWCMCYPVYPVYFFFFLLNFDKALQLGCMEELDYSHTVFILTHLLTTVNK